MRSHINILFSMPAREVCFKTKQKLAGKLTESWFRCLAVPPPALPSPCTSLQQLLPHVPSAAYGYTCCKERPTCISTEGAPPGLCWFTPLQLMATRTQGEHHAPTYTHTESEDVGCHQHPQVT